MQSMADDLRRAARQPVFEVHEVLEGDPPLDLGVRSVSSVYADAIEAALDYLDEHDPTRSGEVSGIEVVRAEGEEREVVWRYGHSLTRPADDLVRVFGFDVKRAGARPQTVA
jgi:hypothetical protein